MTTENSPNCGRLLPDQTHQTVATGDQSKLTKLRPLMTRALTTLRPLKTRANSPNCGHSWREQTLQILQHRHWSERWPHCKWSAHCWWHGPPCCCSWQPAPHPETGAAGSPRPPRTQRPRWKVPPSHPSTDGRKIQCWLPFLGTVKKRKWN